MKVGGVRQERRLLNTSSRVSGLNPRGLQSDGANRSGFFHLCKLLGAVGVELVVYLYALESDHAFRGCACECSFFVRSMSFKDCM